MSKWVILGTAAVGWALLATACAPRVAAGASLTGTVWQLKTLDGAPPVPGTSVTAIFQEDGNVNGNSGCNGYNASYTLSGSSIKIGPPMGTLMACDEPIMKQETSYLGLLQGATRYEIQGETLTLTDPNGASIVYQAQSQDLSGTEWTVISYNNGNEAVVSVIGGTEITAAFGTDGRVTGSAGCNTYFASYQTEGDSITIGPAGATQMFCGEPDGVVDQESQFLAALQSAATYSIQGTSLELRTESGALAVSLQSSS